MNVMHARKELEEQQEVRERLAVFLPMSLMRRMRERVPAGKRAEFVARALAEALKQEERTRREGL